MPASREQLIVASRRALEVRGDSRAHMIPAHKANKARAAERRLDKIINEGVPLSAEVLHQLAQRLLVAAQAAERAEQAANS